MRTMGLTDYSKTAIARWMLVRGDSFLKSAILLKRHEGSIDAVLYNICLGVELVLKSFLLFKDYDKYKPLLPRKGEFGHNLVKLTNEVICAYKIKPITSDLRDELETLNNYYINHYLRYAGIHDIIFSSSAVEYHLVCMKILAAIKLADRKLNASETGVT